MPPFPRACHIVAPGATSSTSPTLVTLLVQYEIGVMRANPDLLEATQLLKATE